MAAARRYLRLLPGRAAGRCGGRRRRAVAAPGAAGQPQCAVRPARHRRHGDGRRQRARTAARLRRRRDHRAGAHRRPGRGGGGEPAAPPGRRARCAGLRQARALHAAGRCLRPAAHHLRRHARLHGRAGKREDGDGAPRRAPVRHRRVAARAGVQRDAAPRLRPGRDGADGRALPCAGGHRRLAQRRVRADGHRRLGAPGLPQGAGSRRARSSARRCSTSWWPKPSPRARR